MSDHSFASILVANRGEIAVRIIRACRAAGLRSVAVYSDADAEALHVRLADTAKRIGGPTAMDSYLNVDAILAAAASTDSQAVHPGYGFLSENADFAERCQQAGLVWIGPQPATMRLLGDKARAKALAKQVGVPTLPGFHGDVQDSASLARASSEIGFPLLVKAAAGGGGRGMRLVRALGDLPDALEAARREAQTAFGDDRLLLERHLERTRHVEVQIFGDTGGQVLAFGERDCSIQRRRQKVVEEAPAPGLLEATRAAMIEAAVALARAARYSSAGTAEFLLDDGGRFYFLEANTRLQVEHPVTECVTGLDLVDLQLAVAAGQPLPISQDDVRIAGHAIEARLYAENPAAGFLPSAGRLERLELPFEADGIRVDSGVEQGSVVPPHYDPLLAKIVAFGPDRTSAIERLARGLAETRVEGIETNIDFLQAVVGSEAFGAAQLDTGFVERQGLERGPLQPPEELLIAAAASEVLGQGAARNEPGDPWREVGPWRVGWVGSEVCYRYAGRTVKVGLRPSTGEGGAWRFELPGGDRECRVWLAGPEEIVVAGADGVRQIEVRREGEHRYVGYRQRYARMALVSSIGDGGGSPQSTGEATHGRVLSPMPGRIVKVAVDEGQRVELNQTLVVLEAMKIEHLVGASRGGVVKKVLCKAGDQVDLGAALVEMEEG